MKLRAALLIFCLAAPALGQQAESLPDLRARISDLQNALQNLRPLLEAKGAGLGDIKGGPLERLDLIERELRRLTATSEELEFELGRALEGAQTRLAALETRICALETECDEAPSPLPVAPIRGGNQPAWRDRGPHFEAAYAAYETGDFLTAAQGFASYLAANPNGTYSADAHLWRGRALGASEDHRGAARAYLAAFSADRTGPVADRALYELGGTLAKLGQSNEACVSLAEIGARFPQSELVEQAADLRRDLGCP